MPKSWPPPSNPIALFAIEGKRCDISDNMLWLLAYQCCHNIFDPVVTGVGPQMSVGVILIYVMYRQRTKIAHCVQ